MATYSELKLRLQALIDRDDARTQSVNNETFDVLDHFIERAEQHFYRSDAAKTPPFEKVITYSLPINTTTNELAIPGDFFSLRYMTVASGNDVYKMKREEIDNILNQPAGAFLTTTPKTFAYGSNFWVVPSNANAVTVKAYYHGALTDLKVAGDTDESHWILNNAADVMLYLAAAEAAIYFDFDPSQGDLLQQKAQAQIDMVVRQWNQQQQAGGTTQRRSRYRR